VTPLIVAGMALVFLSFAAFLTAAESAFNYLSRHDAEAAILHSRGTALKRIMAQPVAHMRALRFWRIWFDMASAVAVTVLLNSLLDNVWLSGLIATGVMALLGFVIVGVSPRQLGRVHSAGLVRFSAPLIRWLCWVLGPIPGWLVTLGSAVAPGAPADNEAFFSEENSANWWTGPRSPT
jgi:CBS domain containing-hemolysin-like protein